MLKRLWQQVIGLLKSAQNNPLCFLLVIASGALLTWITWETYKAKNLGFEKKDYWDLMDLLIVPLALAVTALLFNQAQRGAEQKIADQRFQEEALQVYLDRMTDLLLEKDLLKSETDSEVQTVARAQTLTTLRVLDGKRKGLVLRFLSDAGLIKGCPVILLEEADLRGADLAGANLIDTHLGRVNLQEANLCGARLYKSWLVEADLRKASLVGGDLAEANLSAANLSGADLREAALADTTERQKEANLLGTDLSRANLRTAFVTIEQLRHVKSLKGAILPPEIRSRLARSAPELFR